METTVTEQPTAAPVRTAPWHTKDVFDISTMPLIVKWAEELVYRHKADAIAACGHSGLVLAGAVSYVTRVPVIAVRKQGEPTVARTGPVTANLPNGKAKRWIWLDDFIASGGTLRNAIREMWRAEVITTPVPEAVLSYNRTQWAVSEFPASVDDLELSHTVPDYTGAVPRFPEYAFLP